MQKYLIISLLITVLSAGCPSYDVLRSDRIKNSYDPKFVDGFFYEILYSDIAQPSSWSCQTFQRTLETDGSIMEDFLYNSSGKENIFKMKYDLTKDAGVYNAHPTFEPFGTPATVVDYAEDGSWMIQYKCVGAGFLKVTEAVEVLHRSQVATLQQLAEIESSLLKAELGYVKLNSVDHSKCQNEY